MQLRSYLAVIQIPLHKVGHTSLHWSSRLVTHVDREAGDIGVGIEYVTVLERQQVFLVVDL